MRRSSLPCAPVAHRLRALTTENAAGFQPAAVPPCHVTAAAVWKRPDIAEGLRTLRHLADAAEDQGVCSHRQIVDTLENAMGLDNVGTWKKLSEAKELFMQLEPTSDPELEADFSVIFRSVTRAVGDAC
mmetsp:Transcript_41141/g.108091  ORF Transcript_41141/g.108091 Transcript_41141/m.108091 type:complete len:129 (-) Transcript_41141:292-678(-)